jgi:hypothetical protein
MAKRENVNCEIEHEDVSCPKKSSIKERAPVFL